MPIIYDSLNKTFKLDTKTSSYIIHVYKENYLLNLYYGALIPDTFISDRTDRPVNASFSATNPAIGGYGFSPDTAPMEYGCNGAADFRISALSVRNINGDSTTDLRYTGHKLYAGKPALEGMPSTYVNDESEADTLEIYGEDKVTGVQVTLYYTVFANEGVMTRRVRVLNASENPVKLERAFSLCVDLPDMDYDMITLYGRHNKERSLERRGLAHGLQGIHSKRGSSSHCHNPFAAIVKKGANEEYGWCYGFNLVYSGNFSAMAECDYNGTTRFIMGINPTDFAWNLAEGEYFDTPEAVMVFSDAGIGEMSRTFHRFYNNNLVRGKWKAKKRPILINSWEAAYFDFDTDKLVSFAKAAKPLGIEMLVMDDGWFGKRNCDNSSLGDWYVNEDKLKGGLGSLISQVNAEGLKFGIWYEPEMISPDSDLFRAHPDWHVHCKGREPMQGRQQYVLDVSRKDVRDHLWQMMYDVISQNKIDYIKWDFNRNLTDAASAILPPEKQTEFFHRFVLGTYDLMNRLTTTFPDILLENCSGGGGRFDPAMLCFSPQIWTSDNTDPIERLSIQFGTSMCYPASTMGAHVSDCSRTGIETRGNVALWGSFGYEMDPRKMTDEEKAIVRTQVEEYHKYYDLIHYGELYRLISPNENPCYAVWQFVSSDKKEALLTKVTIKKDEVHRRLTVKLKGLDPEAQYICDLSQQTYSGATLMNAGVVLNGLATGDGESIKLYFKKV